MSPGAPASALAGRGILITRPAEQSAALARLIEREGARPIIFPAIEILELENTRALDALIDRLERFDLAIFISPNAAAMALRAIRARRTLPPRLAIAAIGRGSARELKRQGVAPVIAPAAGADSEALLELPELQALTGWRVVIFRGVGGRELLREALLARGAAVEYAECYRRRRPSVDAGPLVEAWQRGEVHAVVATSSEGLRNLCDMLGERGRGALRSTPLLVPHPRIAASAAGLGFTNVTVTAPGDEGVVQGLVRHFAASR